MIDTAKLNTEELGNIIVDVQNETGFWFDVDDMVAIMQHTVRKADLNGKDEAYVPLLFRNELEDYVMRERINAIGRRNLSCQPRTAHTSSTSAPPAGWRTREKCWADS